MVGGWRGVGRYPAILTGLYLSDALFRMQTASGRMPPPGRHGTSWMRVAFLEESGQIYNTYHLPKLTISKPDLMNLITIKLQQY